MPNRSDWRRTGLRALVTGTVIAGLASCGGSSFYTFNAPNSVVIADFRGNGYNDIAIAAASIDETSTNENPGFVSLALQNTSSPGTFASSVHFATDGNPAAMAVGPIAAPNSVDLAVANFNKGTISVLRETSPGSGTFQSQESVPTGGSPNDVAICDVNGDGYPDLVVADGTIATGGNLIIIPQTPGSGGQFAANSAVKVGPMPTYTAGGATVPNAAYGVACGNLNGDGHSMDVVVTSFYEDPSTGAAYGGSGTLSIFYHDPSNPGGFLPRVDIPIAGLPRRVQIADMNGDHMPDIVISNEGIGSDEIGSPGADVLLQNTPQGSSTVSFVTTPVIVTTDSAVSVAVGDLNGDGMPDIAITSGYLYADAVEIMLNTTTPGSTTLSFGAPTAYAGLGNPAAVAIGDLNHDGLADIATADGTGGVVYLQQTGANAGTYLPGDEVVD